MIPQDALATKNRKKKKDLDWLNHRKFIISYNRRFKGRSSFRVWGLKVSVVSSSAPRFFLSLSSAILDVSLICSLV